MRIIVGDNIILVPVALALQVIGSGSVKCSDVNANIINPIRNFATVIAEPHIDAGVTDRG